MTAHTVTVAVAYMILVVQHREESDWGIDLSDDLRACKSTFAEAIAKEDVLEETLIHEILSKFINPLPMHYKNLFLSEPIS